MDQHENLPSRWTTDPGAIPGEPYDYLDIPLGEDGEIGEAKAVIVEIETPGGSRWEARAFGGRFLGMFETRLVKRGQKTVRPWTNATAITGSRNERRESDEDKREFAEEIKQDWLKFDLCSQVLRVSNDLMRGAKGLVKGTQCAVSLLGPGPLPLPQSLISRWFLYGNFRRSYSAHSGVTCHPRVTPPSPCRRHTAFHSHTRWATSQE